MLFFICNITNHSGQTLTVVLLVYCTQYHWIASTCLTVYIYNRYMYHNYRYCTVNALAVLYCMLMYSYVFI